MVKLHKINTQCVNEDLDIVLEASVERQRVQKFMDDNLGKGYFDKYLKIRDRFTDMNLKDFNKIIKLDPEEVKVAIDRYDSASTKTSTTGGKKKVGENSDWVVYHVTSFPAAQELGEGTEWCITGRYGNMDPNDDHYFNDYITTYIERDVRSLTQVGDLLRFKKFLVAVAARNGEVLNYLPKSKLHLNSI